MSNAGLVRYFDSERDNALLLDPRTVAIAGLLFGTLGVAVNVVF